MISEVPSGVRVLGPGGALYRYGSLFGMTALSDCGSPSFRRGRRAVPSGLGVLGPDGNLHGRGSFFGMAIERQLIRV